ncbi:helix-turn-helix transcriptional regulator [Lacticaseibacillus pabuli]|uniref:Helix-turn-helix transcriptional regulator n=1 Tax=Lacticaseibacillus pabuli TaxID=3025672 RepID=A0ABY7WPZ8_9LACO|nr:helix-turn-helix transcriptional regulator [Lacticaseibacillus sp. KACC 23028]WDF81746.1 helix-turn-helix transcriptional regulator [Lacticaseibacillus sp. KACC 23028]
MKKAQEKVVTINGAKVRELRRQRGLSQSQLAQGICTQATISLIEKRNKVPNLNTLVKVARRLEVEMDDLVEGENHDVGPILTDIEEMLKRKHYVNAEALIQTVNQDKIADDGDLRHFNYLCGLCELSGAHDYDEAVFYFNRVLRPGKSGTQSNLAVLATLGLALSYARMNKLDRSRMYLSEAKQLSGALDLDRSRHIDTMLALQLQGGQVAFALGHFDEALRLTTNGIQRAVERGRLYLLDELYEVRAMATAALGQDDSDLRERARVLAAVMQEDPDSGAAAMPVAAGE